MVVSVSTDIKSVGSHRSTLWWCTFDTKLWKCNLLDWGLDALFSRRYVLHPIFTIWIQIEFGGLDIYHIWKHHKSPHNLWDPIWHPESAPFVSEKLKIEDSLMYLELKFPIQLQRNITGVKTTLLPLILNVKGLNSNNLPHLSSRCRRLSLRDLRIDKMFVFE